MKNKKEELIYSIIFLAVPFILYYTGIIIGKTAGFSMYNIINGGLLFSPELCLTFVIIFFLFYLFTLIFKNNNLSSSLYTLQICATGYFIMEFTCLFIKITIPSPSSSLWVSAWINNFNIYLFHRSHQYLALLFMIIVFFRNSLHRKDSTIHTGNINVISTFLGKEKPLAWKYIALELAGLFTGFSLIFLLVRHKFPDVYGNLYLFIPLFLGALNNSFIEELLFRGILLSRFKLFFSEKTANLIQAILFGLFHSQFIFIADAMSRGESVSFISYFAIQVFILIIYTFLGWIFGRSAIETEGIGISTFIHTSVVMAIYLSKGLVY